MLGNFSDEVQMLLIDSKNEMNKMKHTYIGTEHLLLSILKSNTKVRDELNKRNVYYNNFKKELENNIGLGNKNCKLYIYTPLLKKVIENAIINSKDTKNNCVDLDCLFLSLLEEGEGIALRILIKMGIDLNDLYDIFKNNKKSKNYRRKKKTIIEEMGINLNLKAKNNGIDPVIGREEEVKNIIQILCRRTKNNPVLVGDAGVGKTAIVEELSRLIFENKVPEMLVNKKIISLDMASLVAGTKYRGEFEEKLKEIIKEVEEDDDIILFIDEIHTLVGAGGAEGAIDASNILKPSLARGKIRCIGATTYSEYQKFIEKDSALERRFQKVIIEEPNTEEVKNILIKLKPLYEKFHNVSISEDVLDKIIFLSNKYIHNRKEPDKSIDILDETCSMVKLKVNKKSDKLSRLTEELNSIKKIKNTLIIENKIEEAYEYRKKEKNLMMKLNSINLNTKQLIQNVSVKDVANVISRKTKIPIYEIMQDSQTVIKKLESKLRNNVIGQENVINELIRLTKFIKLGYKDDKCYSLLFSGTSGVGKTLIAKIFAEELVGDKNFIRLDMSEFSDSMSISKLIGSSAGYIGYDDDNYVFNEINKRPYSVILLDEIDKAHYKVIDLLYQILDNGEVKDAKGNIIKFNNTIIIMTTNVSCMSSSLGFNKMLKVDTTKLRDVFDTPFINRIDSIINFNNITEDNIKIIIKNKINKLKEKYKKYKIIISSKAILELINLSEYKTYGARKVDKIVSKYLENTIIDNILNNQSIINIKSINSHQMC